MMCHCSSVHLLKMCSMTNILLQCTAGMLQNHNILAWCSQVYMHTKYCTGTFLGTEICKIFNMNGSGQRL